MHLWKRDMDRAQLELEREWYAAAEKSPRLLAPLLGRTPSSRIINILVAVTALLLCLPGYVSALLTFLDFWRDLLFSATR
jgi:hypothetical protein